MKINRTQLLKKINQNLNDQKQQLTRLANDKNRLEETIRRLKKINFPNNFPSQGFERLRGRLPWPTLGKIMHYFGTPIQQSELKWAGELIEATDEPTCLCNCFGDRGIFQMARGIWLITYCQSRRWVYVSLRTKP